jgi:predicted MFS family arabinose efflux permease
VATLPGARPDPTRGAHPFRSSAFRSLWCSSLASAGAQFMERVATGWLALETGGGPLGVGIVFAARTLPSLLLGLAAGSLADRSDRRRILRAVAAAGSVLATGLGLLVGSGQIALWQVAAIAFLSGCVQVSDQPSRQALVYDSVGRDAAPSAIALNAVASRLFGAIGAFTGGLVIPAFGVANCYFVVAVGFLVSLVILGTLPKVRSKGALGSRPAFRQLVTGGASLIVTVPAVRTLVVSAIACEIFGFSFMTVMPTMARDVLQVGAEGLGILTAASSIGATVSVLILTGLPAKRRREPIMTTVYVLYGAALIGLALSPNLIVAALAILVVGACASAFDALQQTMIQLAVPDDQRGRAVGIWVFSLGSAPLGHLEVGAVATGLGAPAALMLNGTLVALGALALWIGSPPFRPGYRPIVRTVATNDR